MEILVGPLFCLLLYVQYLFTAWIKVTFELHIKKAIYKQQLGGKGRKIRGFTFNFSYIGVWDQPVSKEKTVTTEPATLLSYMLTRASWQIHGEIIHDSCHLILHFSFFSWKVTNSLAESRLFIYFPCVINSNPIVERVKTGEILELASQPSLISVLKSPDSPLKEKKKENDCLGQ